MTHRGESQKEARTPTAFLSPRGTTTIGSWNIRTMYESGRTTQIAREFRRYRMTILGLSEVRWLESGEMRLNSGETILYSGHPENSPHTEGVALMLSREAQMALLGWEPLGSRLLKASFKVTDRIRCNIVQAYAPTNDSDEETKEVFYNKLHATLATLRDTDVNLLMGDLNAKVGSDNAGYDQIMGIHGLGSMNENGELMADLCAFYNMVIGGTVFQHKKIHKATWVSPDHTTENQIDHICINQLFRSSLLDVRARRGADGASDHHLLIGKLRLKLKKRHRPPIVRKKFNHHFLKDEEMRRKFELSLSNRFAALGDEETDDVHQEWETLKNAINETSEEVLGLQKHENKEWITPATIAKLEERKRRKGALNNTRTRATKAAAQQAYTEANEEVKKSIKEDKRRYIDELAGEAEEAAGQGNMKRLYDITKKLSGKRKKASCPIRNKEGATITESDQELLRWAEHFRDLLNRPVPDNPPVIPPAESDLPISCEPPTMFEIQQAIRALKNGKAAGPDDIHAESLKAANETVAQQLHSIFDKVWRQEIFPQDWKEAYLVKIPKKGDLSKCENYRGISLLSVPGKVFNRVILNRMRAAVDERLREEQAGFRPNRSCTDQIASLRIIVEQSLEWNSSLYLNFIDYEKAFDSVHHNTLWQLMRHYGIPQKIVNIVQKSYENLTCKVLHNGSLTQGFQMETGVRQGCLLSPLLFLFVVDWIMENTTRGRKNGIQWTFTKQLEDLDYADDIVLMSHTHRQMQEKTSRLSTLSTQTGLRIHQGKTKVMRIHTKSTEPLLLNDKELDTTASFTYLGSIIDEKGGTDADISARIGKARVAFRQLSKVWRSSLIRRKTKIRIFNSNVKSVLLYGSETWRVTKASMKKVQSFINRCLRYILKIFWPNIIKNEDLWEATCQHPIEEEIKQRKWRWIGHTLRRGECIQQHALRWNPQGKRKVGRPRNTWRRDLEAEIRASGWTWMGLRRTAQDRGKWRKEVVGPCLTRGQGHE